MPPPEDRALSDVWSALGGELKPSLDLVVIAPFDLERPIDVGLDGEALEMDPPLVFSMRPEPLRVRIPGHAIGYSPAAMAMDWRSEAKSLGRIAAGRPASLR